MSTYYFLPTRNVFGEGAVQEAGDLVKSLGAKKCLIVTDRYLGQIGMADRVQGILEKAGIEACIFAGAEPNPTDKNVEAGARFYQENECNSIISLGGGSSHDCAKGIGLVAANGGRIADFEGVDKSSKPMIPLMAINTTAGTASEITRFCIITDTSRKVKMAIVDWRVTPQIAINDPELMKGMPPSLTASTGMDALTHAIEAYVSTDANPLTDAAAIMAIKMIAHYLPKAVANGNYMKARDKMAYAQYLAGIAFNNASLGYVHAMAHQLGGFYNLPHGVCNAILLPFVIQYNSKVCMERYAQIARYLGLPGYTDKQLTDSLVASIKELNKKLDIKQTYAENGVTKEHLEQKIDFIAEQAVGDPCTASNPRPIDVENMKKVITCAFTGEDGPRWHIPNR